MIDSRGKTLSESCIPAEKDKETEGTGDEAKKRAPAPHSLAN